MEEERRHEGQYAMSWQEEHLCGTGPICPLAWPVIPDMVQKWCYLEEAGYEEIERVGPVYTHARV